MGQYYQGPTATFVDDAMFKLPYEQMANALLAKDKAIDNTVQQSVKLHDFEIAHHQIDNDDAKALKASWDSKIDETTQRILDDPLGHKKVQKDILRMQRELNKDIAGGDIYALGVRKTNIDAYQKELEEMKKKDPETYAHQGDLFKEQLNSAGKYIDPTTGKYNYFSGEDLLGATPMSQVADDAMKNMVGGDMSKVRVTEQGLFEIKTEKGWEGYSDTELMNTFGTYLAANPLIAQGYAQKHRVTGGGSMDTDIMQGINYLKAKYGKRVVKDVYEKTSSALGDHIAIGNYDDEKEKENLPFITETAVAKNLTSDIITYSNGYVDAKNNSNLAKTKLVDAYNKQFPKDLITTDLPLSTLITKLKKVTDLNPGVDYSKEIMAAREANLHLTAIEASRKNFSAYAAKNNFDLKDPKQKQKAFNLWSAEINSSDKDKKYVVYDTESSYQGTNMTPKQITALQKTYDQNFLVSPFSTQGFKFKTTVNKQKDVTVMFPSGPKDPNYVEIMKGARDAKGHKIPLPTNGKPYAGVFMYNGKKHKFHNEYLTDVSPTQLNEFGYIETRAVGVVDNPDTEEIEGGTQAVQYFIPGSSKPIQTFSNTYMPANAVDINGKRNMTATARFGDESTVIHYRADAPKVVLSPDIKNYWDKTESAAKLERYLQSVKGTGNLSEKVEYGGKTVRLENGVIFIEPTGKSAGVRIEKGNAEYEVMLSNILDIIADSK